ncbi:MAG: PilN domain-containing protein [Gemmatimonadetes bacterium]|nr:PilN domain-containing protein [Gemmatimonadota bacterium]
MLEVNLLPGPKKKKAAGGVGLPVSLDQIKAVLATVKDPLLVGAVGAWAVSLTFVGLLYVVDNRRLAALDDELSRAQTEHRRFAALITQKRKAEALRDSLIVELAVIRTIDGERFVWPHILEEITRALPDYTWLVGIEPVAEGAGRAAGGAGAVTAQAADTTGPSVRFTIEGRTSDIQAYTRFLRQMANSPWFTGIVAGATTTAIEQARPVTAFTLTASFRRADSAYIRTAPLLQTLR